VRHLLLIGVGSDALAVPAIIEGEDVDAQTVEGGESGKRICQGTVAGRKDEEGGVRVAAVGSGNPPAGELRNSGFVRAEVDELVGYAVDGFRGSIGARGMKNDLPLSLVEEKTKRKIAADESHAGSDGDGFDEPDGIHCFGL